MQSKPAPCRSSPATHRARLVQRAAQYDRRHDQGPGEKRRVMQINFSEGFLSQRVADAPRRGRGDALNPDRPRATLDDLVAHIDHAVKLVGIDYVGLGSDYDGVPGLPVGLD